MPVLSTRGRLVLGTLAAAGLSVGKGPGGDTGSDVVGRRHPLVGSIGVLLEGSTSISDWVLGMVEGCR